MAFLERVKEALIKQRAISPNTPESEKILKDKFVNWAQILRGSCKSWLLARKGSWRSSYKLPIRCITTKIKMKIRKRKGGLRNNLRPSLWPCVLRQTRLPEVLTPSAMYVAVQSTGNENVLTGDNQSRNPNQKPRAMGVSGYRRKISYLPVVTGVTFSVLLSISRQLSKCGVMIRGISRKFMTKFFFPPLGCTWADLISFLIMPESPTPFLGRNVITELGTIVY